MPQFMSLFPPDLLPFRAVCPCVSRSVKRHRGGILLVGTVLFLLLPRPFCIRHSTLAFIGKKRAEKKAKGRKAALVSKKRSMPRCRTGEMASSSSSILRFGRERKCIRRKNGAVAITEGGRGGIVSPPSTEKNEVDFCSRGKRKGREEKKINLHAQMLRGEREKKRGRKRRRGIFCKACKKS